MTTDELRTKQARIREIRRQIDECTAMLDGVLLSKRNRVKRKDGSVHLSPEYFTFQYCGADGARKWKRIPKKAASAVKRLVRVGKRYRALEREYTALMTELSLRDAGKKNG